MSDHHNPHIFVLDGKDIDAFLTEHPNTVIDFWAPWCGPCKTFAPVFGQAAYARHTDLTFAQVNVDADPRLAARFNVRSIPTLVGIKNGDVTFTKVGSIPRSQLEPLLDHLQEA